ncbi:androgen-induced gene 1 protein-like [Spea bombifrons]|uniref:androgen-induced gene 1 protein-like n=1 Tax=Spea bombifrons TaxID=233779 RepID=UPI002349A2BE|nr:androgen-induced gene 1 protein-like [Spea bombifrons]
MAAAQTVLHLAFLAWNVFGVWQNLEVTGSELSHGAHTYGGRWKYLTFINQVLQTVFFGVCVLADLGQLFLSSKNGMCSGLVKIRDYLFAVLAFPIGVFVVFSFWSIYAYDRELVYPKVLDSFIPPWLNHIMHTFVLPLLLVELFVCSHQYPSKKRGLLGLGICCLAYLSWILWVHHASGIWVYPILQKLDAVGLMVFLAASVIITVPFYQMGESLTRLRWGGAKNTKKKKVK